ncbi:hypothetical protein [Melghirimyces profundicolus]|uniref:hypothetical protein n=1 Tax=Melghirimyces profundicolus TaxID=1242148 RepID=UPI000D350B5C|nr:hypothetical protein [Melghirimyces profundicolus]
MGLIAHELERKGISTVMVTLLPESTRELGVPRSVFFPHKLGAPIGRPGQPDEQYQALLQCLDAFETATRGEMIEVPPA